MSYQDRGRRTDEALRVLPALVTGQATVLDTDLEVRLAPGSSTRFGNLVRWIRGVRAETFTGRLTSAMLKTS
jgi:hypothetical protein